MSTVYSQSPELNEWNGSGSRQRTTKVRVVNESCGEPRYTNNESLNHTNEPMEPSFPRVYSYAACSALLVKK